MASCLEISLKVLLECDTHAVTMKMNGFRGRSIKTCIR